MQKSARLLALLIPLAVVAAGCSDSPGSSGAAGGSGGNASSGGTSASGGAVASGGTTSSPNGGSAAATGGNTSAAGGTTASAGGTSSALGGATAAAGGTTSASGGSAAKTGGTTTAAGGSTTASGGTTAALGGSTATTGGTTSSSAGGTAAGGTTSAGGSNGGSTASGGASGGSTASGGSSGGSTASGGTGASGGTTAKGGTTTAGGSTASGGSTNTGPSVTVSPACTALETKLAWPTAKGSTVIISGTKSVTTYDGGGALHEGTLNDCSIGDQSSTKPIIEVADGGSVSNVIFGKNIGDGIHCLGSCTIDNVWYPYICDDAITVNKDGTASKASTISNSGFKGARDKIIQHNGGDSTLNITSVYAEVGGKIYRSCGSGGGCTTSAKHTVNISNVVAIAVDQVAGVSENDQVTLSNICAFRTPTLCNTYKVNSDTDSTKGANGTGEGPSPNCAYQASDSHALVDRVAGATLSTDVLCPGSNSAKSGSTATACIAGFDACLKVCAPGMYGLKQLTCSAGSYTSPATGGCALVTATEDSAAAAALASSNSSKATSSVAKNTSCSTEWAWGTDNSTTGNYCVCAEKPGYYQKSTGSAQPATWMVWDCQSSWW